MATCFVSQQYMAEHEVRISCRDTPAHFATVAYRPWHISIADIRSNQLVKSTKSDIVVPCAKIALSTARQLIKLESNMKVDMLIGTRLYLGIVSEVDRY